MGTISITASDDRPKTHGRKKKSLCAFLFFSKSLLVHGVFLVLAGDTIGHAHDYPALTLECEAHVERERLKGQPRRSGTFVA